MTDNATPKRSRPNYSRPTKYPARLAVMLTTEQRASLDAIVEATDSTLGEVTRALLDDGLAVFDIPVETWTEVRRMAREGGVTEAEAMTTMLDFAARESKRRLARNARIAAELTHGIAEAGFAVDGVEVDGTDVHFEGF